jgi:hypothetical protein
MIGWLGVAAAFIGLLYLSYWLTDVQLQQCKRRHPTHWGNDE